MVNSLKYLILIIILLTACQTSSTYHLRYDTGIDEFMEGCLAGVALMQMEYYEITDNIDYLTEEQRNRICINALKNKRSIKPTYKRSV